jgi:hypothetical protein
MDEQQPGQTVSPKSADDTPVTNTDRDKSADKLSISHDTVHNSDKDESGSSHIGSWQFKCENEDDSFADPRAKSTSNKATEITWSASEFVAHEKSLSWYAILTLVTLVVAAGIYLLTRDKISTSVIIVAGIVLGAYGRRKPRVLDYRLDESGITVDKKFFDYDSFNSFSVVDEGAFSSVVLMPLKRFSPSLTIYFAPDDEDKIIAMLADRLPVEDPRSDPIDRLMHRIRF